MCTGDVGRLSIGAAGGGWHWRSVAAPRAAGAGAGPGAPAAALPCGRRRPPAAAPAGAGPGGGWPAAGGCAGRSRRLAPIALTRNGKDFKITGNQSTVRAGTEIKVKTERPEVNLSVGEMNKDSWVLFELPGFTKATLRDAAGQHGRLAQGERDLVFQGRECPLGQAGSPARSAPPVRPTVSQTAITVSR